MNCYSLKTFFFLVFNASNTMFFFCFLDALLPHLSFANYAMSCSIEASSFFRFECNELVFIESASLFAVRTLLSLVVHYFENVFLKQTLFYFCWILSRVCVSQITLTFNRKPCSQCHNIMVYLWVENRMLTINENMDQPTTYYELDYTRESRNFTVNLLTGQDADIICFGLCQA